MNIPNSREEFMKMNEEQDPEYSDTPDGYALRIATAELLDGWGVVPQGITAYEHMRQLLGNINLNRFNEGHANTLRMLLGPNGYTIYRMLLVQRGIQL